MNNENIRKIMKEYQFKRDRNQSLQDKRIKEIYDKYPDIKYISDEIMRNGLKMTKAAILEHDTDGLEILEKRQNELIKKKYELFDKYNITNNYMDMSYDCNICKDTGFLDDGTKCNCLKQRILNDAYAMSNLQKILEVENFETFNLDLFSNEMVKGFDTSPREYMKNLFLEMNNFVFNFGQNSPNNLIFIGPPGLGKTFMCSCIAREVLKRWYTVIYQTSFNLMDVIERYKFRTESYSLSDEENYRNLFNCDLLIIDDLGTEMPNSFTTSELFNIINSRINSHKTTIISTNLSLIQIRDTYTDRVLSRIVGNFKLYEFFGDDLRF